MAPPALEQDLGVTALYEVRLAGGAARGAEAARIDGRWLDPASREASEAGDSVTVGDLDGAFTSAGARLWVDYSAAYLAEFLRAGGSERPVALEVVARIARSAGQRTRRPCGERTRRPGRPGEPPAAVSVSVLVRARATRAPTRRSRRCPPAGRPLAAIQVLSKVPCQVRGPQLRPGGDASCE